MTQKINTASKFTLGKLVFTRGVNDLVADNEQFARFVTESLGRHTRGDWGELSQRKINRKTNTP